MQAVRGARAAAAWGERKESVPGAGTGALDAASDICVKGGEGSGGTAYPDPLHNGLH